MLTAENAEITEEGISNRITESITVPLQSCIARWGLACWSRRMKPA